MLQIVFCQCSWKYKSLIFWSNNSIGMNILARVNKTKHKNKLGYYCSHFLKRIFICIEYFFHPLTFSLYVSFILKCGSYRQHIYRSCFCIHSVSLGLLVGVFNTLTFKLIIDMYIPIPIFLLFWGLFLWVYFSFYVSCLEKFL